MTQKIALTLRDSKSARWTALVVLSFTMFAGYMFTEVISPLKPIIERSYGMNSTDFGFITSAYGIFNVFFMMLIIVGILLDKFGIRFSTISSAVIMIIGACVKYAAFKGILGSPQETFTIMNQSISTQVFWAGFGFALFGVGVEYAGITVSKSVAKWFKGKEMALAMGMQVAIARVGSFAPLAFGAKIANSYSVPMTILIVTIFLILGLVGFFFYNMMDKKLDKELALQTANEFGDNSSDEFKFSDLKVIISNRGFWLIALLCVLFYSAVFPFYKYGPDLMVNKFGVSIEWAGLLPSLVPFGTMLLTPFFGSLYDKKGKGATIMMIGAILLIIVHTIFYLPQVTNVAIAFFNVILLGIAFSLVPSAMWPSVPKIIPEKQLGSAYAFIFWVQNFGLWGIPLLIGIVLNATNPTIVPDKTLVSKTYTETYQKAIENSPIMGQKTADGQVIDKTTIDFYAQSTSNELLDKIVQQAPQTNTTDFQQETLKANMENQINTALETYFSTQKGTTDVSKTLDTANQIAIEKAFEVVKKERVKLNYNYQNTWKIFIVLTILAFVISLLLKAEDKRKGYGLEKPNIKND